jgi:hypothetical protein
MIFALGQKEEYVIILVNILKIAQGWYGERVVYGRGAPLTAWVGEGAGNYWC